jgi:hypothetical protein
MRPDLSLHQLSQYTIFCSRHMQFAMCTHTTRFHTPNAQCFRQQEPLLGCLADQLLLLQTALVQVFQSRAQDTSAGEALVHNK